MTEFLYSKELLIFEFSDEVDAFLRLYGEDRLRDKSSTIIVLETSAQVKLHHLNIPCYNSLPFFGRKGHEISLLTSNRIVQHIRKELNVHDELGVREGYKSALIFFFRFFLHHLLFLTEILDSSVKKMQPSKVVAFEPFISSNRQKHISNRERYLGEIVREYCINHGIEFQLLPRLATHNSNGGEHKFVRTTINLIRRILFPFLLELYTIRTSGLKPMLFLSKSNNLPRFLSRFQNTYQNVLPVYLESSTPIKDITHIKRRKPFMSFPLLPMDVPPSRLNSFKKALHKNMGRLEAAVYKEANLYNFKDVDISKLVLSFIKEALFPYLYELYGQTIHLDQIIKKRKPSMVIAQHSLGLGSSLGELSRSYGIPSMLISHGSHVPPRNRYEEIEWGEHGLTLINTHYEYLAVQSPWTQAYLEHNPTTSKTIKTGPVLFATKLNRREGKSELRKCLLGNVKERTIILHAGTPKARYTMRFFVYETIDEYIENIISLIRAVENIPDTYLVLRFRPTNDLSVEDLRRLLPPSDCYGVHSEGSFEDFLMLADLLVSYSSTTIEEALQNRIPVLQYDPQGKYCHIPCQVLDNSKTPYPDACYFVGREEDLKWALSWIIDNHLNKAELPASVWKPHIFSDDEIEDVAEYFKNILH